MRIIPILVENIVIYLNAIKTKIKYIYKKSHNQSQTMQQSKKDCYTLSNLVTKIPKSLKMQNSSLKEDLSLQTLHQNHRRHDQTLAFHQGPAHKQIKMNIKAKENMNTKFPI